jgi:hypothetical protein
LRFYCRRAESRRKSWGASADKVLKLVEEATADLTDEIIESYNIILLPKTPYTT